MRELRSEIEILASAERVWQLLTDFPSFPQWNPLIRRASGNVNLGEKLKVFIRLSGASRMTLRPTVLKAEPNHELRWLGSLLIPGLFDGEHIFTIEALGPDRVRFIQREIYTGILVPLLAKVMDKNTQRGFVEMNQALKEKAEQE